jgi:cytochrome c oxidase assembly protein subunit 15
MDRLRRTLSPREYRTIAYLALAFCTLIVFTGAAVRLTGSGLGCPEWPRCHGTDITPQLKIHGLIEFSNRVMTTIVTIPCVLAAILAWRRRPFRRDLALLALLLPLGVLGQAVMGGLTVLYGLAPGWVIGHFLLSMALLVAAVALAWRATFEPGERPGSRDRLLTWSVRGLLVPGALTLSLGTIATASGPHAGGEGTGDVVHRFDFKGSSTVNWLINRHGVLAALLGLLAVATGWIARRRDADPELRTRLTRICVLLAVQGVVGIVQFQLELPAEIVWVHVALATLTWVGIVLAAVQVGSPGRAPAADSAAARPRKRAVVGP